MGLVDIVGDIKSKKNEKKAKEEAEKLKYYEEMGYRGKIAWTHLNN